MIIDRYGDRLVLQTLTLAMDMRKNLIVEALADELDAKINANWNVAPLIIERNDAPVRKAEGLELVTGVLEGAAPSAPIVAEINGTRQRASLQFEIDLLHGHKTGFYLDQRENYGVVGEYSLGRRVLDCFTNQGGFALACAQAGAAEVTAVEASSENLAAAKKNAERNKLSVHWIEQDVFQFLRAAEKAEAQYDLIILDPPSFTKTKGGLHDAMRGYKELHVRAFKLLARRTARDIFLFAPRQSGSIRGYDSRCLGRCAQISPAASPFRTTTRSSGLTDLAGDGILQRLAARNDAG